MTYGEIRFRAAKQCPGCDLDLLDGWLQDRYSRILDRLPWQRLEGSTVLQTVAAYVEGTVTVTAGDTAIAGDGTAWTALMTGRSIVISGRTEPYTFTRTSDTEGTLDRAWEGESGSELTYSIYQSLVSLPSDARGVNGLTELETPNGLDLVTIQEIRSWPAVTGTPAKFALTVDTASFVRQAVLYPAPAELISIQVDYTAEQAAFSGATSVTLLPWLRPAGIIAGVMADWMMNQEKYEAADRYERQFEAAITDMVRTECQNSPGLRLRLPSRYTAHRRARASH